MFSEKNNIDIYSSNKYGTWIKSYKNSELNLKEKKKKYKYIDEGWLIERPNGYICFTRTNYEYGCRNDKYEW